MATSSYAVQYVPSSQQSTPGTPHLEPLEVLNHVKFVRVQWVDLINNIRFRVLPIEYFKKVLKTSRPGISVAKVALGLVYLHAADGFSPIGEYLYVVDLSSLKICGYAPGHASVMGWFQEKVPKPFRPLDFFTVDLCPRTILKKVLEDAKKTSGVEFLVGFETEFILLWKADASGVLPVDMHGWSNSQALYTGHQGSIVLEEIVQALTEAGVEVQMYHSEAAPGQYELITGPLPPLEAADALIHTRETIYNIANKYKMRATLAPRLFADSCGSAAHTHMSVHSSDPKLREPSTTPNLTKAEAGFLAGVLRHLPALTLLTLPTDASYARMVDGAWSGGTYVSWGTDNREAPVRLTNEVDPGSRNFELKTVDGTANPYLVLAGVLGTGHIGIQDEYELKAKNCNGILPAALMTEEQRKEFGVDSRLPLNLEQARVVFQQDEVVSSLFGSEFVEKFVSVNKVLSEELEKDAPPAVKQQRLVDMY
ncbi:glutamine synthetase/guanido kinase [Pluteus cervinus]|uniref:Glutamine synthetase/guanido kinase n=1 Tax=Pluteus cervinus TaxID=181527 RepID=A0ACD3AIT4_9AGAR|nr:glutamine synthetase/guanido kinase [Pluteus cervinus]